MTGTMSGTAAMLETTREGSERGYLRRFELKAWGSVLIDPNYVLHHGRTCIRVLRQTSLGEQPQVDRKDVCQSSLQLPGWYERPGI